MSDKFFIEKVNGQKLDTVIQRVASLATMKENSIVSITPRLDNNILNLICNSVLWTNEKQKINKGIYYVINIANRLYNILFNDKISIGEKFY